MDTWKSRRASVASEWTVRPAERMGRGAGARGVPKPKTKQKAPAHVIWGSTRARTEVELELELTGASLQPTPAVGLQPIPEFEGGP